MADNIPKTYLDALVDLNAGDVEFFERDLLDHLQGVYQLLLAWNTSPEQAVLGLFHAVYLTEFFDSHDPNEINRNRIREIIGTSAEGLVYAYCVMDRRQFVSKDYDLAGGFEDTYLQLQVELSEAEDRQLVELIWANSIEQVYKLSAPKKEFEPLIPLFESSRHRVGKAALVEYQRLL